MHYDKRTVARGAALLIGILALGACERELPTEVGGEQVPESSLRTYEVILEGAEFLLSDSLVRGFGTSNLSSILVVAEDYRDTLDSHALVRFGELPITVTYVDSSETVTDTVEAFADGRIVLRVDSLSIKFDSLVAPQDSIEFRMFTIGESFDARTATWTARNANAGDTLFWTTPGGTPGTLIGTRTFVRGDSINGDSLVFTVDSAIVAEWAAGPDELRGVMVTTATAGARAHVVIPRLTLDAHLENDPDSITRVATAIVLEQTYVYDPAPPEPVGELRVGDRSAWRSFLAFAPGLDTLELPCPEEPGCTFRLGDVTVNRAELRLTGLAVPTVWRPRLNLTVEARPVLGDEALPFTRAPLGDTSGVALRVTPETFAADGDSIVRIGVTRFVRGLLDAGGDSAITERDRTLAILTAPEPISFGIGRFGAVGGPYPPTLRLIVTLPPRAEEEE